MPYTDVQLEEMLADVESDLVERKESLSGDAQTTIRETICAFANDLPGHGRDGVIFVGAKNNGQTIGLEVTDSLLVQLGGMKDDGNIVPPPTLTVGKRRIQGADVAVISVTPSDSPPVRYRGRIWVRTGPRRSLATAQDERILSERRRYGDRPYDAHPLSSARISDLSLRYFEEQYLPSAFSPDVLEANERTTEQRLMATKMVTADKPPVPTVLGVLTLGTAVRAIMAGAYVQFLRLDGPTLATPVIDEQLVEGRLEDLVRRLDDKLASHNRVSVDFTSSTTEKRHPTYPLAALQQVTRNAILHRTYEGTHAPVRVYWYSDRIEVVSPGGPFGSVTRANFGEPGITVYRNPNLAEAMRVLGLVQRFGAGIPTAEAALRENGNPPLEFSVDSSFVVVTLRPRG